MARGMFGNSDLTGAAHIVQLALSPIFLLTGIASLLNVFSTRLGRIADQVDRLAAAPAGHVRQLAQLRLRTRVLDVAVLLATLAGALTCGAAMTLFLGALRETGTGRVLFALFGGALSLSVLALIAFAGETLLSGRAIRERSQGD